jgi:hypothetical protein
MPATSSNSPAGRFRRRRRRAWGWSRSAGFGLGYHLKRQPIRLSPGDQPIEGRLVDLEGRPVAGVRVRLGQVWVPAREVALDAATPDKPGSSAGKLGLDATPLYPDGVVTDADGRFRLAGLGRESIPVCGR